MFGILGLSDGAVYVSLHFCKAYFGKSRFPDVIFK